MSVVLYQMDPSFYSHLARVTLVEKGVAWESRNINIGPIMENYEPWYMRIHPAGVVPALDHDGTIVTEAIDVMRYVDANFEGPSLSPEEPELRERMEQWLERMDDFPTREFSYGVQGIPALKPMVKRSYHLRRKVLRKHRDKNPDLAERYEARLRDIDTWEKVSTNPDDVEALRQKAQAILDDLEAELAHGNSWLFGEQYTLIDIWMMIFLSRLAQFKMSHWWEGGERPLVEAYYLRLKARPSFVEGDVWTGIRPGFMFRMLAPFLLPRLTVLLLVLGALSYGVWWLFQ